MQLPAPSFPLVSQMGVCASAVRDGLSSVPRSDVDFLSQRKINPLPFISWYTVFDLRCTTEDKGEHSDAETKVGGRPLPVRGTSRHTLLLRRLYFVQSTLQRGSVHDLCCHSVMTPYFIIQKREVNWWCVKSSGRVRVSGSALASPISGSTGVAFFAVRPFPSLRLFFTS